MVQASRASDTAKDLYGPLPELEDLVEITNLTQLSDEHYEKEVTAIARADNARVQSAKLTFLMLRQQGKKVQAVVAAVSRSLGVC